MNELGTNYVSGNTLYAIIFSPEGKVWNNLTSAFENAESTNWINYAVTMTESDNSGIYIGNFPVAITSAGFFPYDVRVQSGGSPVVADFTVATGSVNWTGSNESVGGTYLISLDEYNAFNNTSIADQAKYNTQVTALIPAIADQIDMYLQWHVIQSEYNEILNGTGQRFIRLNNKPIVTISSITLGVNGNNPTNVDVSSVIIDQGNFGGTGMIRLKPTSITRYFDCGKQNIEVQYIAGYDAANVPQQLKYAASLIIKKSVQQAEPKFTADTKKYGDGEIKYGSNWMNINNEIYSEARSILDNWKKQKYIF